MDAWERKVAAYQRRRLLKARAVKLLGGACRICGYDRCPGAMDFHHPEAGTKDLTISDGTSWKRIEPEVRKCVLLCARCHREVHAGLHPGYLVDEDSDRQGY